MKLKVVHLSFDIVLQICNSSLFLFSSFLFSFINNSFACGVANDCES